MPELHSQHPVSTDASSCSQDLQSGLEEAERSSQLAQIEAHQKGAALRQMEIRLAQVTDMGDGYGSPLRIGGGAGGGGNEDHMHGMVADLQRHVAALEQDQRTAASAHLADLRQIRQDHSRCGLHRH